ncbi:MAG: HAD family hydrolase, partial [bacterium]
LIFIECLHLRVLPEFSNLLDVSNKRKVPASIQLFVFDWDGTLLDSAEATLKAYITMFEEVGISLRKEDILAHYSPNWYRTYLALGLPESRYQWADKRWLELFHQYRRSLVTGAREVLTALQEREYRLTLLTAAATERVRTELKEFRLESFFCRVVTMEQFGARKPDPMPLQRTLESMGILPHHAIYVGDTVEDIQMGRGAGTLTLAVQGPYVPLEVLAAANPSFLVKTLTGVLQLLSERSKP